MKTPEKILKESINGLTGDSKPYYRNGDYDGCDLAILDAIKAAQLEGYSTALNEIVEELFKGDDFFKDINKGELLCKIKERLNLKI